jgi:hypothetical protein
MPITTSQSSASEKTITTPRPTGIPLPAGYPTMHEKREGNAAHRVDAALAPNGPNFLAAI